MIPSYYIRHSGYWKNHFSPKDLQQNTYLWEPGVNCQVCRVVGGDGRIRTADGGFADLCLNHLATSPYSMLVPRAGFEPTQAMPTAPSRQRVYQFHHLGVATTMGGAGTPSLSTKRVLTLRSLNEPMISNGNQRVNISPYGSFSDSSFSLP
jgi:hypothetical protein